MDLKKSQIYRSLWSSCDELRGGMDASQYKDYVLTLLFLKYVSDKYAGKPDAVIEVPKGSSFGDIARLKGDKEIGEKLNIIIANLAKANDLKGVIDVADFNDEDKLGRGKEMQDRLSRLVAIFDGLDLRANRADGDDLLGDAYEYLMRHFATESGKSKGQFYTPAEVSRIMAKVIGIERAKELRGPTVYDPTCGSGSLLIKAADESSARNIAIYGQEMDNATWALARMNMFLHDHPTADIWKGNTLSAPYFKNKDGSLKTFDFAVANPPFSSKAWINGLDPEHDEFERFEYGVPPAKNGDYAFLLHLVKSLKSAGKGAIILPHGVLFRGHKEAAIRKNLVKRGLIKGIVGLPPNLFYGTGIPACIVVVDKENAHARKGIFMVDASKGFIKDGNKNRLRSQDIHKIVDVFNKQVEVRGYSRLVPHAEIASEANDYNLNIPRYIDSAEPEDLHDLDAHLRGGIPEADVVALSEYWSVFPSLRAELFANGGRKGYVSPKLDPNEVKPAILAHPEFLEFSKKVEKVVAEWRKVHADCLTEINKKTSPKDLIHVLSEDLLARFGKTPLLSRYDAYQRMMDYWAETMQDDVYLVVANGWKEAAKPRGLDPKDKKGKETPDLVVGSGRKARKYKMDLIPPELIVDRFFADQRATIEKLEAERDAAARELEEFLEENSGEEVALEDTKRDKGKVTKGGVKDRLKEVGKDKEFADERKILKRCLELMDAESEASKAVKEAQEELDAKVLPQYGKLAEKDIINIVVNDKWFASITSAMDGEVQRLTQNLAGRVKQLEERYATPLPELEAEEAELREKVEEHLKKMGLVVA